MVHCTKVKLFLIKLFCFFIISGGYTIAFEPPKIPEDSAPVYRFRKQTGHALTLQNGGSFSLSIMFDKNRIRSFSERRRHRDQAQEMLDAVEKRLRTFNGNAKIEVATIYAHSKEIVLNVTVDDPTNIENIKRELIQRISKTPGVRFTGSTGRLNLQ